MQKFFFILIVYFVGVLPVVMAQFQLTTEFKYLHIINSQENTQLIVNNLSQAESQVDSLLLIDVDNELSAKYLLELARSYQLLEDYEHALFSVLKQRCFFPSDANSDNSLIILKQYAYELNMNEQMYNELRRATQLKSPLPKREAMELLIKWTIRTDLNLVNEIDQYNYLLNQYDVAKSPFWLRQWYFYRQIEIKRNQLLPLIMFNTELGNEQELISKQKSEVRKMLYRKAFDFYYDQSYCLKASEILNSYEKENLTKKERKKLEHSKKKLARMQK